MRTPGDDTSAADTEESRVEVYVTTDTSAAPHKAGEPRLYVMYDAAHPDGDKLYFTKANGRRSSWGSGTSSWTSTSRAACLNARAVPSGRQGH
jgi:hypothetical protein